MPHTNAAGLALIESFEGERLLAYDDGTGVMTIGYGHTANVLPGQRCSQAQAAAFLAADVAWAERAVVDAVHVTLTPNQFSALVSFQYNTGGIAGSTLVQRVNARDWKGAHAEFGRWVYAGGRILDGLVRRRAAEARLFIT